MKRLLSKQVLSTGFLIGLVFFSFFLLFPFRSFAAPLAYKITLGIPVRKAFFRGEPFFATNFKLTYQSGPMILSLNPDGTGDTLVDDRIEVRVTKPNGSISSFINNYNVGCNTLKPLPPKDITNLFAPGINKVEVFLRDVCGVNIFSSALYVVNMIPDPSPSPTPSPTPVPTPAPFLELPWDYGSTGKSFSDIVFDPNSWFDHKYPLQNVACCIKDIVNYLGEPKQEFYKSHNGYDYGIRHGVILNTPVLAAAPGTATLKKEANSGGAGNVIKINHGNGYQTWYEHLSSDNLVVSTEGQSISVAKGQHIGQVGMTGNTDGPHIHFSVFKDTNNNGSFDDEIPYGVVDPLGWEGTLPDPWISYAPLTKNSISYPLFKALAPPSQSTIPTTGGLVTTSPVTVMFPFGFSTEQLKVILKKAPFEAASELVQSAAPSFIINAFNSLNQEVHEFLKPITLTYDYSSFDLANINEDTLSLYYFNESTNQWEAMPTTLNITTNLATTTTTHFSHFALMGSLKDLIPPITQPVFEGDQGESNWFRSNVRLQLNAQDNPGGLGVAYTLYRINSGAWQNYTSPLLFTAEGTYQVEFFSSDTYENREENKTVSFTIDKTTPQATLSVSPTVIWPPNGKMIDVIVKGTSSDANLVSSPITVDDEYDQLDATFTELNTTIQLEARRDGEDMDGRIYTLSLTAADKAGNQTIATATVTVPHDQGKGNDEKTKKN